MTTPPEHIRTARLLLRKPPSGDAPLIFKAYAQDAVVTRYLTWQPHADISETRAVVDRFIACWRKQTAFCWFLFTPDTGELIGAIEARREKDAMNLGFVLARPHWGKGYMPKAITPVVEWAFTEPRVSRIWAACDIENHSSARALEKPGFAKEGVLRQLGVHR